jgi:ribose 5-phosphate isomerase RpiB
VSVPTRAIFDHLSGVRPFEIAGSFGWRETTDMLSIGVRVAGEGLAFDIADASLAARFEGGRHSTRAEMIGALER